MCALSEDVKGPDRLKRKMTTGRIVITWEFVV